MVSYPSPTAKPPTAYPSKPISAKRQRDAFKFHKRRPAQCRTAHRPARHHIHQKLTAPAPTHGKLHGSLGLLMRGRKRRASSSTIRYWHPRRLNLMLRSGVSICSLPSDNEIAPRPRSFSPATTTSLENRHYRLKSARPAAEILKPTSAATSSAPGRSIR